MQTATDDGGCCERCSTCPRCSKPPVVGSTLPWPGATVTVGDGSQNITFTITNQ